MSTSGSARVRFSVIVPVYEQWDQVPKLLQGLAEQSLGLSAFEIVLVDNGSSRVPTFDDRGLPIRLLRCDAPGSYAARNHGLRYARGEVMAFTDADCVPDREWLTEGLAALRGTENEVIIAGRVRVVPVSTPGTETAAEQYDLMLGFPQARYVDRGYGVTANLFVPRALLDRFGGFDTERFSGGDAAFCRRLGRDGVPVIYAEAAAVSHPARRDISELIRKVRRVKGGQLRHGKWQYRLLYAVRGFLPPVRAIYRIAQVKGTGCRQKLRVLGVQMRLWIAECVEIGRLLFGGKAERR